MPTFLMLDRFKRDLERLTPEQREAFSRAVKIFVEDLRARSGFRRSLRIKRVQGTSDVWEMTWAPDGRATWQPGEPVIPGEAHVIWRRIGTHEIFGQP